MTKDQIISMLQDMLTKHTLTPEEKRVIQEAINLLMQTDYYDCISKRYSVDQLNQLAVYDPARFPNPDMMNGYNMGVADSTRTIMDIPPYSTTNPVEEA